MTWPARTWVVAELVTATIMNAYVRDPLAQIQGRALAIGFGDASGDVLPTGVRGYLEVPFACTVTGWSLFADQVGSIVIDVWKDSYANFPPTIADTIAGSEKPTLAAAQKNQDLALTTWTTALAAGDVLAFNIASVASIKAVSLSLRVNLA